MAEIAFQSVTRNFAATTAVAAVSFTVPSGAFFALVGYIMIKLGYEPAPMLLGFVLGKLMEEKLRQSLILSRGSFTTFIERPVSATLLAIALIMLVIALLPAMSKKRDQAFQE